MRRLAGSSLWMSLLLGLAIVLSFVAASPVLAHDPGLSAAELVLSGDTLVAQITFARVTVAQADTAKVIGIAVDGRALAAESVKVEHVEGDATKYTLTFTGVRGGRLTISAPQIASLARGHRQYVIVYDTHGRVLGEAMLDAAHSAFETSLAAAAPRSSFTAFLVLGVEHILTGYDHLLFLFGLLIVGGSVRSIAKIVTAFTLAHSVTLAASALQLVSVPSRIVEPLIAASIVYVGVENLMRKERQSDMRWLLALAFGLVHGFGFASALAELGIGSGWQAAPPLIAFNLGVELGQMAIAVLVLPIVWRVRQYPKIFARAVPATSLFVAAMGAYWLITRLIGAAA